MVNKVEIVDVVNTRTGQRRRWRIGVWNNLSKDKNADTRGDGWALAAPAEKLPEGEVTEKIVAKVSAAPIVKKKLVVAAEVKSPDPEPVITEPNGKVEEPAATVTEEATKTEEPVVTEEAAKPKPKRNRKR